MSFSSSSAASERALARLAETKAFAMATAGDEPGLRFTEVAQRAAVVKQHYRESLESGSPENSFLFGIRFAKLAQAVKAHSNSYHQERLVSSTVADARDILDTLEHRVRPQLLACYEAEARRHLPAPAAASALSHRGELLPASSTSSSSSFFSPAASGSSSFSSAYTAFPSSAAPVPASSSFYPSLGTASSSQSSASASLVSASSGAAISPLAATAAAVAQGALGGFGAGGTGSSGFGGGSSASFGGSSAFGGGSSGGGGADGYQSAALRSQLHAHAYLALQPGPLRPQPIPQQLRPSYPPLQLQPQPQPHMQLRAAGVPNLSSLSHPSAPPDANLELSEDPPASPAFSPTLLRPDFAAPLDLRRLRVPADLVPVFLRLSDANSRLGEHGVETCGVLAGGLRGGAYVVTHLFVPKQKGLPDRTEMLAEEELPEAFYASDVIQLGWVHTHPSQDVFLSSVDLHTHLSFQQLIPESVAVVVAPRRANTYAAFRLTDGAAVLAGRAPSSGIDVVAACGERGFHPLHLGVSGEEGVAYERGGHVSVEAALPLAVVDMR